MAIVKQWTESEREGWLRRGGTGRACNINPFNKLIIDEIYRAFTVRGGGANALHLSRGNPGYISGLAPLRLDLRARANEPRPASATRKEVVQDDAAAALGRYGYDAARGSWASLKIYSIGMAKRRKRGRVISAQSTVAEIPFDFARSEIKQNQTLLWSWEKCKKTFHSF